MGPVSVARSYGVGRLRVAGALAGLLLWLAYTRVFWTLSHVHATLPPCPFLFLTGQPCPLCGGTRSYAAMWQGDLAGAARYHPLGPALFVLTLLAALALGVLLATGRTLRWSGDRVLERRAWLSGGGLLLAAWLFRMALLPLPPR